MSINVLEYENKEDSLDSFIQNYGNEVKQTTAIDCLSISFLKELPEALSIQKETLNKGKYIISKDCYLVHLNSSLNGFKSACNLFILNQYVGKLLYNPIQELDKHTVHLLVENSIFYSNDFIIYIDYLITYLNFKLNHIVKLDIANDYIKHNILDFYDKYKISKNITHKGKAVIIPPERNKKLLSLYIGSSKSDKQIRVYDKTKELEYNSKPYILDFWKANKLNYQNKVERIELILKTGELKNIDLFQLNNPNYLLSICKLHFKNFFEFNGKYKVNGKIINKDVTPIDINFSGFKTISINKKVYVPSKNYIFSAKIQLKKLYKNMLLEEYLQNNETDLKLVNPEYLDNSRLTIERYLTLYPDLINYYNRKIKTWKNEFIDENITNYNEIHKYIFKNNIIENNIIENNTKEIMKEDTPIQEEVIESVTPTKESNIITNVSHLISGFNSQSIEKIV